MNQVYQEYINLLNEISSIPEINTTNETFISICGYPHYERVISNILAFFFDSQREHGLKTLFIQSLLNLMNLMFNEVAEFSVLTEVHTTKGNYIDLLLLNDEMSIVIENKIFANLYNDLDDYYSFAKNSYKHKTYGIVLGISEYSSIHDSFISITYKDLFKEIKKNLGSYILESNSKYNTFLFDFIENITTLTRSPSMNYELLEFVNGKADTIDKLEKDIKQLRSDLRRTVKEVNQIVHNKSGLSEKELSLWEWRELPDFFDVAVADFTDNKISFAIDSKIDSSGWTFSVFDRNNQNEDYSSKFEKKLNGLSSGKSKERFYLDKKFKLDTNNEQVANFICQIIEHLLQI